MAVKVLSLLLLLSCLVQLSIQCCGEFTKPAGVGNINIRTYWDNVWHNVGSWSTNKFSGQKDWNGLCEFKFTTSSNNNIGVTYYNLKVHDYETGKTCEKYLSWQTLSVNQTSTQQVWCCT